MKQILLIQLGAMGDCFLVTVIARQIKEVDYPNCHLTWAIGVPYQEVLINNPYVDEIICIDIDNMRQAREDIYKIRDRILASGREFDKIIINDFIPENYKYFYGTIRNSWFRIYGKLTVPPDLILNLLPEEKSKVADFATRNNLTGNVYPIIFECSPRSQQARMNVEKACRIANRVIKQNPQVIFLLSTTEPVPSQHDRIITTTGLSWRENAELTKYCQLFIGSSSGVSWLNLSTAGGNIPMIQNVCAEADFMEATFNPSVELDLMALGLPTDNIIELIDPSEEKLTACICCVIRDTFPIARQKFRERKDYTPYEILEHFATNTANAYYKYKNIYTAEFGPGYHARQLLLWMIKKIIPVRLKDAIKHHLNANRKNSNL